MPIRRSPNGARHPRPQAGRDPPEQVVAINRNAWSQSIGMARRDHPVRVEPVFGQIKQARGFRQFLLRGVEKVRAEWAMICTAHNLMKLFTLAKAA